MSITLSLDGLEDLIESIVEAKLAGLAHRDEWYTAEQAADYIGVSVGRFTTSCRPGGSPGTALVVSVCGSAGQSLMSTSWAIDMTRMSPKLWATRQVMAERRWSALGPTSGK